MHVLSVDDLTTEFIVKLFHRAEHLEKNKKHHHDHLDGYVLASIFLEASTRTRLSTETAMWRLGGKVATITDQETSSLQKGETLSDTLHAISHFVDLIAIRQRGSLTAEHVNASVKPLINCGDGEGNHPTQALLDAYTIWKHFQRLDHLRIFSYGDPEHARAWKSLAGIIQKFSNGSTKVIELNRWSRHNLMGDSILRSKQEKMQKALPWADVVYVTRSQQERWQQNLGIQLILEWTPTVYAGNQMNLDKSALSEIKEDAIILHPLPRRDELSAEIDSDPRVKIWEQVNNGMFIRMALIEALLLS